MKRSAFKPILLAATLFAAAQAVWSLLLPGAPLAAQQVTLDSAFLAGYSWRNLGPEFPA